MKCLTNAIGYMIPEIIDATYTAQLHSSMSHPPELQPILAFVSSSHKIVSWNSEPFWLIESMPISERSSYICDLVIPAHNIFIS